MRSCAVAAFLFLFTASLLRAEQVIENVPLRDEANAKLRVLMPVNAWDGFGFLPVMVSAENNSDEARSWRFGFTSGKDRRDDGPAWQFGFSVTAPPRTSRTSVFWLPGGRASADGHRISVDMTVQGSGLGGRIWTTSVLSAWRRTSSNFAVSPALESAYRARRDAMDKSLDEPSTSTMMPAEWPADWRVWSPFAVVVMTADEFDMLDKARRDALLEWVALGGHLFFKPQTTVPRASPTRHGLGAITTMDLPANLYEQANEGNGNTVATQIGAERVRPWRPAAGLLTTDDVEAFQLSQATWGLVIFLLVFGVVIGPVNLFLWAPAGKRHRLFFTVPVISLGASLLLAVVIVFHDGFGGEGARRALVVLMPGENKAVVAQEQISRTGLLLGKNFALPDDTVFAKIGVHGGEDIPGKTAYRRDGSANGDWFTSRARESHLLLRVTPTRGRVEIIAGGDAADAPPVVQSSMAGMLRDFVYLDASSGVWTADEVPPGRRVTLRAHKKTGSLPPMLYAFSSWREAGRFYAEADGGELAPLDTLKSIRWKDDKVFVTGRMEGGSP